MARDEDDLILDILASGGAVIEVPLTEDGTPDSEAFFKSLAEALDSIPSVWVGREYDPEWSTPRLTHDNQIVGSLLLGIMQASGRYTKGSTGEVCEDEIPDDLTGLAKFVQYEVRNWPGKEYLDDGRMFEVSLNELGAFLWERVHEGEWFTEKTSNTETAIHNALIAIRNKRREFDRFNADFDKRWAEEHPEERDEPNG